VWSLCPRPFRRQDIKLGYLGNGKQPNIILFFIDDLGWPDIGVHGSTFIPLTPVLIMYGESVKLLFFR
jgi:hypothetical protein